MGFFENIKKIREGLGIKTKHMRTIEAMMFGYKADGIYFYHYSRSYNVEKIMHTDNTTIITLTEEYENANYIKACNIDDHHNWYDIKILDDCRTIELVDNNSFEAEAIFLIEEVKGDNEI